MAAGNRHDHRRAHGAIGDPRQEYGSDEAHEQYLVLSEIKQLESDVDTTGSN